MASETPTLDPEAPAGPQVLVWDAELGQQVLRPATEEEIADIEARQALASVVPVPAEITMRQARLALHAAGLLTGVEAAINAMPDPPKTEARIEWEYSNTMRRSNPFVANLGAALGLTSAQVDALFIQAAAIP